MRPLLGRDGMAFIQNAVHVLQQALDGARAVEHDAALVVQLKAAVVKVDRADKGRLAVDHDAFGVQKAGCIAVHLYMVLKQFPDVGVRHRVGVPVIRRTGQHQPDVHPAVAGDAQRAHDVLVGDKIRRRDIKEAARAADELQKGRLLIYVGDGCPTFAESYRELVADCSSQAPLVRLEEEDDAAIYFSSGTTGFPKAILHNHESLSQAAQMEQKHHLTSRDDVFLCIPPLYHTGAKFHWMGSLYAGSKAVLLKGTTPEIILDAVSKEQCTIVWLLVPWAQDILVELDSGRLKPDDYELSQWRLMHIGAQPVPQSLIRRWKEYFPNHQYDTNYGLSESIGPGCVHLGVENIHKVGAIGVPGYGWEAKIIDTDGNEVKQGEVGELAVKGPGVMKCYYNDEEATKEVLHGDWLYTGDMAEMDEDGFIYLVDRKKDVIISGGENLYPVQIENYLSKHEAVKDVAVIGLKDDRLGEIAAAIIELVPGAVCTEDEMNEFCKGLPRYKRPRKIFFADVPRNPTGKIEKPKLRKMYQSENLVDAQNRG